MCDEVQNVDAIDFVHRSSEAASVKIDDSEVYSVSGTTARKILETEVLTRLME